MGRGKQTKKNNQPSTSKNTAKNAPKKKDTAPDEASIPVNDTSSLKPLVEHAFWAECEKSFKDLEPKLIPI